MKKFTLTASVFLIWFGIAGTYYTCIIKGLCSNEVPTKIVKQKFTEQPTVNKNEVAFKETVQQSIDSLKIENDTISELATTEVNQDSILRVVSETKIDSLKLEGFKMYNQHQLVVQYSGNFKIYRDSNRIQIPFGLSDYGYVISKYMDENNTELAITGYYNTEEAEDIGLARANNIAGRLMKLGIPGELIKTASKKAVFEFVRNQFRGGIKIGFKDTKQIVNLNHIDYNNIENINKGTLTVIRKTEKEVINKNESTANIAKEEIVPKKQEKVMPTNKIKEVVITKPSTTPKIEKIANKSFRLTEKNFKGEKLKAPKGLKLLANDYKKGLRFYLQGYSNETDSSFKNYQKGLGLAISAKSYLIKQGVNTSDIIINSKKGLVSGSEGLKKGVLITLK